MDLRDSNEAVEGKDMMIVGTIKDRVHWDFSVRRCEDDLAGIVRVDQGAGAGTETGGVHETAAGLEFDPA